MKSNWAGNVTYSAERFHEPTSVEQLQEVVAGASRVHAVGTGHSFNPIADSPGDLVSTARLPLRCEIDERSSTVTVSSGTTYAELASRLHASGHALANLASLPHISVAGACATGTHGSGAALGVLGTSVVALEVVGADGELASVRGGTDRHRDASTVPTPRTGLSAPGLDGVVVALGALGVVTTVTLALLPTFEVRQVVYDRVSREVAFGRLDEVLASAYSVSLFTRWAEDDLGQVWVKHRVEAGAPWSPATELLGAPSAREARHPVPGMDPATCTQQLGVPGAWHERLPHFRVEHTPSSGDELQSEYLVARADAPGALDAIAGIATRVAPVLQISEIRSVAADQLWLSPAYHRDSVAIHFTWIDDTTAVAPVVDLVEERLAPFAARPHWGKVSHVPADRLHELYERLADFSVLAERLDPDHRFRNDLLDRCLSG